MKKNLLLAAALLAGVFSYAQCDAVDTLNEEFNTAEGSGAFPQNCWISSHAFPMTYVDTELEFASFYTSTSENTAIYIVSPQINNIDGAHALSFDTFVQAESMPGSVITIQAGTLSAADDFSTFVAVGDLITLGAETISIEDLVIPASDAQQFIAFKFMSSLEHGAAGIDNVVWEEYTAPCAAVTALNEGFDTFTGMGAFPQNCWTSSHAFPMTYVDTELEFASFYSSTSENTAIYIVSPELSNVDGAHALSFDTFVQAESMPGSVITIQAGTLSDAADYSTFVAVGELITLGAETVNIESLVIPASDTQKYIAFKFISSLEHGAAGVDNVVWEEYTAPCVAVATLDEDFNDFSGSPFPDHCWTSSHGAPYVSADTEGEFVSVYAFMSAETPIYVVSPEVTAINGAYSLSFDAFVQEGSMPGGVLTLQAGTLAAADDFASFEAIGEVLTLAADTSIVTNYPIQASETHKFIAFKVISSVQHGAAGIDNVKWDTMAGVVGSEKAAFGFYPNPSVTKNITLTYDSSLVSANAAVSIYTIAGAKVFETAIANTGANATELNLSSLSSGMYIVKFESGSYTASQKLVIQ
jgi:RNase P/RNase MRP subunit POP5